MSTCWFFITEQNLVGISLYRPTSVFYRRLGIHITRQKAIYLYVKRQRHPQTGSR